MKLYANHSRQHVCTGDSQPQGYEFLTDGDCLALGWEYRKAWASFCSLPDGWLQHEARIALSALRCLGQPLKWPGVELSPYWVMRGEWVPLHPESLLVVDFWAKRKVIECDRVKEIQWGEFNSLWMAGGDCYAVCSEGEI